MMRGKMLHDDDRCVDMRYVLYQLLQRLEPSCRGADANNEASLVCGSLISLFSHLSLVRFTGRYGCPRSTFLLLVPVSILRGIGTLIFCIYHIFRIAMLSSLALNRSIN